MIDMPVRSPDLAVLHRELRARAAALVAATGVDWLVVGQPEHVGYVTGYRPIADVLRRDTIHLAAIDAAGNVLLCGPAADHGPVVADGLLPVSSFIPYGRFYFEGGPDGGNEGPEHHSLAGAASELLERLGDATVGVDRAAGDVLTATGAPTVALAEALALMRVVKTASEIDVLSAAAHITGIAIDAGFDIAAPGVSERTIAVSIARTMAELGAEPRVLVVASGERSALSDVRATARTLQRGDLLRIDVGCVLHGYWSDVARTGVLGPPSARQRTRYEAIAAGQLAELDRLRPGVPAADLFDVAVATVRSSGLDSYRRHHCGHGIGREAFEAPVVAPTDPGIVADGTTLCLETPFYELGWGGMMIEDMVVASGQGCHVLTTLDRELRVL